MVRWLRCALAALIVMLWMLSVIILSLATIIRDNLSKVVLVTEGTAVGDFYLTIFFPVIFPILITASCFLFVIGCLGCFGAFTDSQRLLGWFFFSILITFCVELSAGIWRMVEYDLRYNSSDVLQLKTNVENYAGKRSMVWFADAWKEVHRKFNCCGVYSSEDWLTVDPLLLSSCCPQGMAMEECVEKASIRPLDGCGNKLLFYLVSSQYMDVVPYLSAIIGIVQVIVLGITLKIWLIFCFSPKKQAQTDTEVCVSPTLYRYDEKCFVQEQEVLENGCYLTPLKSYKDYRCLKKADLKTLRREETRLSQQHKPGYPIFLLTERDKQENCYQINDVKEFKTTRFQPNVDSSANSTNSKNAGQYKKLSQSCSYCQHDRTTVSQITNITDGSRAIMSNTHPDSHCRMEGVGSSDGRTYGHSTSRCKLSSKVNATVENNIQHKNLYKENKHSHSDTSHSGSRYSKHETRNDVRKFNHVLNGKVETKTNLTDCDISLEMSVHCNTATIST